LLEPFEDGLGVLDEAFGGRGQPLDHVIVGR